MNRNVTTSHACVYNHCFKNSRINKDTSFFKFPVKNPARGEEWKRNCGNSGIAVRPLETLANKLICEDHFLPQYISISSKRKLLRSTAVPIKFSTVPVSNETLIPKTKPAPKLVDEIKVPIITRTGTLRTYGNQKLLQDNTTKQTSFNCSNEIGMLKDIKQEPEPCDTQQPPFNFCDVKETSLENIKEEAEPSVINPEPIRHTQCISPVQYNKLKRKLISLNLTKRRMKAENYRLRKKPDFNEALYRNLDVKSPSVKTFVLMQVFHKRGTEWTQSEKDLALSIYMKSPTTYRFLFKRLGFVLPSPKTISTWALPKSPLT